MRILLLVGNRLPEYNKILDEWHGGMLYEYSVEEVLENDNRNQSRQCSCLH